MTEYQTTLSQQTPIVITLGNFDGVHLGHQHLLQQTCTLAQELNSAPVMVTFMPHTLMVVRPQIEIYYLTTLDEKLELAQHYGKVAHSIVIHFTPEVAALSATDFMDELCSRFSIRGIVVGSDFSLGNQRMGNCEFLKNYGRNHNIRVEAISLEESDHTRISSTRIRALVTDGKIAEANELLGHPMLVGGIVQHGDERGRLLGFPTANLRPTTHKLLPANGVYAILATLRQEKNRDENDRSPVYKGVANIGVRPTFDGKERRVEVHLLHTNLELYDSYLQVEFIAYLRGEQRFSGVEALKTQISADVQKAEKILTNRRVSN